MQKALMLAAVLMLTGYASESCASQSVSATIMLAVYLPPPTPTTRQAVADTQTATCSDTLTTSQTTNGSVQNSCQDNSTDYIWTSSNQNQDVQLVVAPI